MWTADHVSYTLPNAHLYTFSYLRPSCTTLSSCQGFVYSRVSLRMSSCYQPDLCTFRHCSAIICVSIDLWHRTTFHFKLSPSSNKSQRVRPCACNTALSKPSLLLTWDDGSGHVLKILWPCMVMLKYVYSLLTACPFPPDQEVPQYTVWNRILAVADPPVCL